MEGGANIRISVALSTYNGERYLGAQLESIAAQSRLPDELVVRDDCSLDSTVERLVAFTRTAPFEVRLQAGRDNLGAVGSFGAAISACRGDVIALADQDDVWLPDKLARLEATLVKNRDVGLVFSDAEIVDSELRPMGYTAFRAFGVGGRDLRRIASGDALSVLIRGGIVSGCTLAFRAAYRDLVLPFPKAGWWIHDGWIALMVAAVADVAVVPVPLVKYRRHPLQELGAPESGVRNQLARTRPAGRGALIDSIMALSEAQRRLQRTAPFRVDERSLRLIDRRIQHLNKRAAMPAQPLHRVAAAARSLASGEYVDQPRWIRSFARDILG
ncbi:MAG TPA: glycosyltransferase family 2 protein [Chloroflexota bacterium]|nr:glycosyltransferase family 2 protein [Chloroflexota bacterium]